MNTHPQMERVERNCRIAALRASGRGQADVGAAANRGGLKLSYCGQSCLEFSSLAPSQSQVVRNIVRLIIYSSSRMLAHQTENKRIFFVNSQTMSRFASLQNICRSAIFSLCHRLQIRWWHNTYKTKAAVVLKVKCKILQGHCAFLCVQYTMRAVVCPPLRFGAPRISSRRMYNVARTVFILTSANANAEHARAMTCTCTYGTHTRDVCARDAVAHNDPRLHSIHGVLYSSYLTV